ncbi:MAG TPA: hypothetical protein PLK80_05240 [bacterium]|nr:MAG: hypothetical protein BWY28_01954 [bacterium ADurb.Bin236]HOY62860.1 hypothetical protein [bacterium]HPI76119.1 hypothetical protein [bacterium]HPN93636.1 hypothetical protein [bacterium]
MSGDAVLIVKRRGEMAEDFGDGLKFVLSGRGAEAEPEPVVRVDGSRADAGEYVFDPGDAETAASVTFHETRAGREVKCDYAWRLECGSRNELSVYEVERELNVKAAKDANGRTIVTESAEKTTGWRGLIVWEYAEQTFWDEIRRIAETVGTTFDLKRASLAAPLNSLERLYPASYPAFKEIPGMPGFTRIAMSVIQLEA